MKQVLQNEQLTLNYILNIGGPAVYDRAEKYVVNNRLFNLTFQGTVVHSMCSNGRGAVYKQVCWLKRTGVKKVHCTCPAAFYRQQPCKHAIALLLQWKNLPKLFRTLPDFAQLIRSVSPRIFNTRLWHHCMQSPACIDQLNKLLNIH